MPSSKAIAKSGASGVRTIVSEPIWVGVPSLPAASTGTIRQDQGIVESFTRATKAWIEFSDGLLYEVAAGEKKHNHLGLLSEGKGTNRIWNSGFNTDGGGGADVFASWTEAN